MCIIADLLWIVPFWASGFCSREGSLTPGMTTNQQNEGLLVLGGGPWPLHRITLHSDHKCIGYSNTIVSGSIGEDVILPCIVKYEEEFSYDSLIVRWKIDNIFVQFFFYGDFQQERQNKIFKERTQLFYTEFPKGNLSLLLHNVQTSDTGIYQCLVITLKHRYGLETELVVQDKAYAFTNKCSAVQVSAAVLISSVVLALITVFFRRRKRSRGSTGTPSEKKPKRTAQDRRQPIKVKKR